MEKRRREAEHVMQITVRLSMEDSARLKEIAGARRIPVAILVRTWIGEQIEKYQSEQAREESSHDVPR